MLKLPIFFLWLFSANMPANEIAAEPVEVSVEVEISIASKLYMDCGLASLLDERIFLAGYERVEKYGQKARILAIADMGQPSTAARLYIIDLEERKVLMRTYVAHGQRTGDLMAEHFSNENDSHKTSLGLYRVGEEIVSPKHGAALLLHGLEQGLNCQALPREIIMHGADYVSEDFIRTHGRLGRSWGCPAVSRKDMPQMVDLLANGGLLYIHG